MDIDPLANRVDGNASPVSEIIPCFHMVIVEDDIIKKIEPNFTDNSLISSRLAPLPAHVAGGTCNMFSEILSKYLEARCQSLAAPAVLSVKVDGVTYSSTDWTSAGMSLNGASSVFQRNAEVHGILECDGVSGPFSGEIVGNTADQPFDIRFQSMPANVLMMLNMARAA